MTALVTSLIATDAASAGGLCSSWMCLSMFSMTTIASSTTSPVASVTPNSVSVLIEKPNSLTNANVPTSDTGIVIAGISVVRQFWRNRNMTSTTRPIASASVVTTSRIDSETTLVVSNATSTLSPGGKRADSLLSSASTSRYTCSELAVGSCSTPTPTASRA